jgi:hypothetical protein
MKSYHVRQVTNKYLHGDGFELMMSHLLHFTDVWLGENKP